MEKNRYALYEFKVMDKSEYYIIPLRHKYPGIESKYIVSIKI